MYTKNGATNSTLNLYSNVPLLLKVEVSTANSMYTGLLIFCVHKTSIAIYSGNIMKVGESNGPPRKTISAR